MKQFVYAIYNKKNNKIYIGQTNNLDRRLNEHNSKFGNHYTAKVDGDWEIVYQEIVLTREEALKREKQLKSCQGRKFIKTYIPL
ncbi:GIY-YIG nuclease family protein [Candidatus Gottesmanbacteria bacterium]|nr:GIY-YIG nuclease family protein [Candidatus Gottesmanbacteria bacterium]